MILQVIADALVRDFALNAGGSQHVWITNARKLEDLWSLDGTTRHDDFAFHIHAVSFGLTGEVHANCLVALELHGRD